MTVPRAFRFVIPLACILAGCSGEEEYTKADRICAVNDSERQQWVLDCIEKGNPMSDEEPEDLVKECSSVSSTLFCEKGFITSYKEWSRPCALASTEKEKRICGHLIESEEL